MNDKHNTIFDAVLVIICNSFAYLFNHIDVILTRTVAFLSAVLLAFRIYSWIRSHYKNKPNKDNYEL